MCIFIMLWIYCYTSCLCFSSKQATQQTTINPGGASYFNDLSLPYLTGLELNSFSTRLFDYRLTVHRRSCRTREAS